jgi:hypothetical protein
MQALCTARLQWGVLVWLQTFLMQHQLQINGQFHLLDHVLNLSKCLTCNTAHLMFLLPAMTMQKLPSYEQ